MLSIVIPTLNSADFLEGTLKAVGDGFEIIIVDGGSGDLTPELAARLGLRVVEAPRGRGVQLAAGAKIAKGDWLLFLHADTVLEPGWDAAAGNFMKNPENARRAAVFRLKLDDPAPRARRLERLAAWRGQIRGLPYGDQGLLISRPYYHALGGFTEIPLMEDVDMIRRIGKGRLVTLDAAAVTSAERYQKDGYILRPLRNLLCLGLYFIGVPPRWIARLYG
ncbi:MAG TPA: glycosyltransferase [Rhodospirillales bacterium]|nr:glycosyltransferase [Rhodospirillales bacterium]